MWSDIESGIDYLNYSEIAALAVEVIHREDMLPVAIGVFGPWGSGKSSMLKLIRSRLYQNADSKKYVFIEFDAWLYQGYEDARSALMSKIGEELLRQSASDKSAGFRKKLKGLLKRINWRSVAGYATEGVALAVGMPGAGKALVAGASAVGRAASGEMEEGDFESAKSAVVAVSGSKDKILKPKPVVSLPSLIDGFRHELKLVVEALDKTVVVFVDNLDRCLPEQTIHTLETLRLFLSMHNTAFVIAADEAMIQHSVKTVLGSPDEKLVNDYIDKLIQVPIRVPLLGVHEINAYLVMLYASLMIRDDDKLEPLRDALEKSLRTSWMGEPLPRKKVMEIIGCVLGPDASPLEEAEARLQLEKALDVAARLAPLLAGSSRVAGNPRTIKRILNVIGMRSALARRRGINVDQGIIAKIALFEKCTSSLASAEFYRLVNASPDGKLEVLGRLERDEEGVELPHGWKDDGFLAEWIRLDPPLGDTDLRAAAYLSRETITLRRAHVGLSAAGQEALLVLKKIATRDSVSAKRAILKLSEPEKVAVMQKLIDLMRAETSFDRKPTPFIGAITLASHTNEGAELLLAFCRSIDPQPPWLKAAIKNETWYTED